MLWHTARAWARCPTAFPTYVDCSSGRAVGPERAVCKFVVAGGGEPTRLEHQRVGCKNGALHCNIRLHLFNPPVHASFSAASAQFVANAHFKVALQHAFAFAAFLRRQKLEPPSSPLARLFGTTSGLPPPARPASFWGLHPLSFLWRPLPLRRGRHELCRCRRGLWRLDEGVKPGASRNSSLPRPPSRRPPSPLR